MPRTSTITPGFSWDERARGGRGAYRENKSGRFITQQAIVNEINRQTNATRSNIHAVSERYMAGEITLADWQKQMATEIKNLHLQAAAASRGGWAQMTQSDYGWVGQRIRTQYEFLRNFAKEVETGKQPLNGRFLARADLYAKAEYGTFAEMGRRINRQRGFMEGRRVLGAADHCPGCVEEAERQWVSVETMAPIGSKECRTNCQCHEEFRMEIGDGEYVYARE